MNVDNIFDLLNKFDKEEDRISAGFGFLLEQNRKMLRAFLRTINISLSKSDLKKVDIETQFSYASDKSRIDLRLTIYGKLLVFLESKIVKNEDSVIEQLNKYASILNDLRNEYDDHVRLIYVSKFRVNSQNADSICAKINLDRDKIFFLCWEELLQLAKKHGKGKIYSQFESYLGDKMYSKRTIKEQRLKELVEVLIIHTNEENWELITRKKIAVQGNSAPNAQYLAFYRTHRKDTKGKKLCQAITHIADVVWTESNVPRSETVKGVPELERWYKETNRPLDGTHKHYKLGKLVKLNREIPFIKGGKTIGQVKFKTKMSELLRVKTVSELVRLKDLES